jgi:N-acetyl sugar amidotransferase
MAAYQICSRCIMDTTDADIRFNDAGVCNHCLHYDKRAAKELFDNDEGRRRLELIVSDIKKQGRKKEYDCVIGLSGDWTVRWLPTWSTNSVCGRWPFIWTTAGTPSLAVCNVEKIVKALKIDLYTHIIDWEEFKDLQLSFLKASVINSEIPTDHAITALMYETASRMGIKYIIGGGNIATECIMPTGWGYDPKDWKHIKAIHKKYGTQRLRSYPHYTLGRFGYYLFLKRIKYVSILNYMPYRKNESIAILEKEFGWRNYGDKHFESIFTRFFQGYILPTKFNIDKRRAHLSTLVCSGQITREEALKELLRNHYLDEQVKKDWDYVLKKLALTQEEFEKIMARPPKRSEDYPTSFLLSRNIPWLMTFLRKAAKA